MATQNNLMQKPYWKFVNLCSSCYGEGMNLKEENNYKECTNCNHSFGVMRWGCIGEKGYGYVKRKTESICFSCSVLLQSCQCCGVHVTGEEFGLRCRKVDNTVDFRELRSRGYNFKKIVPMKDNNIHILRSGIQPPPLEMTANDAADSDYYSVTESISTLSLEDVEDGRFS